MDYKGVNKDIYIKMTTRNTKTQNDRLCEVIGIYKKLTELGISEEVCPGISIFRKVANTFVKEGVSLSGKIKLTEIERELHYLLSKQAHIESSVMLKVIE